jgi:hypothetical protein
MHTIAQAKRFEKDIKKPEAQRAFVEAINQGLNGQDPRTHFDIYREKLSLIEDNYNQNVADQQAGDLRLKNEVRAMIASAYGRSKANKIYSGLMDRMEDSRNLTYQGIIAELRETLPRGAKDETWLCEKFHALFTSLEETKARLAPLTEAGWKIRKESIREWILIEDLDRPENNYVHYLYCNHVSEQEMLRGNNPSLPSRKLWGLG